VNDKEQISVVVCDDSALMRNLVGKMVENADGLVLAGKAMNGRFLLQKLPRLQPDVIVLDLEMPDMNGIDVLRRMKTQNPAIPVILSSAFPEFKQDLGAWASDEYVVKSSNLQQLKDAVHRQLD
jgi:chemotaxis response regulator CheB